MRKSQKNLLGHYKKPRKNYYLDKDKFHRRVVSYNGLEHKPERSGERKETL